MTVEIDENLCPLCGQDNNCLNVKCGGDSENNCWCNDKRFSFPPELTNQVPEHAKHKACICQSCAEDFHSKN
ncbi:MAG: cysteine-rich CWC family protein [Gammaproteobacteria bacterium]|nr:cysteine-rich CWC family protein [Gammaproteobacteria bacterium]